MAKASKNSCLKKIRSNVPHASNLLSSEKSCPMNDWVCRFIIQFSVKRKLSKIIFYLIVNLDMANLKFSKNVL